jgi:hypothetical protein
VRALIKSELISCLLCLANRHYPNYCHANMIAALSSCVCWFAKPNLLKQFIYLPKQFKYLGNNKMPKEKIYNFFRAFHDTKASPVCDSPMMAQINKLKGSEAMYLVSPALQSACCLLVIRVTG